ncbi:MAG: efflux transporter outer membrane subunit [Candidatus Andeanibacterium colombiense]|uniref:Efflux transporter outer membrane subunit n=1 Tax=Candidatus Andeanibacterium colombiense TaxID=3121345 RepID=A0AAJ5X9J2_9SPHN|nr:MAG: efflux transporter outer membrane subunit [Sphingomonadaceae bacterium]
MRTLAGLALATALAGCALQERPAPEATQVVPPADWRSPTGASEALTADWWNRYGDPQLTALVERAIAHNTDIAVAAARVRQALAQERAARAQLLPSVSAGPAVSDERSIDAFGQPRTTLAAEPTIQASWQVDLFGRTADLAGAARQRYLASQAAHDAAVLSVAAATARGYIALRGYDARLAVTQDTLASRSEALRIARSRADAGYTSRLELNQAEAEYQAAAALVPQLRRAIAQQENALSQLAGDVPGAIARAAELTALSVPPVPAGLPSELLRRRPDIAQAEYQLSASDRSLSAARKAFLPNLQLTGSTGLLFTKGLDPTVLFSLGGSILAPLFSGGRLTAQLDEAASVRDQAAFAYRGTALTAFREVDDALAALATLQDQERALTAQRDALREALGHAIRRYQAGYTTYLEQLDAQRGLLSAELALAQARADLLQASVTLYAAMGGGWTMPPTP